MSEDWSENFKGWLLGPVEDRHLLYSSILQHDRPILACSQCGDQPTQLIRLSGPRPLILCHDCLAELRQLITDPEES
jgi:hypothetical protein